MFPIPFGDSFVGKVGLSPCSEQDAGAAELLLSLDLEGDYANALELSRDGCTLFLSEWDRRKVRRIASEGPETLRVRPPIGIDPRFV